MKIVLYVTISLFFAAIPVSVFEIEVFNESVGMNDYILIGYVIYLTIMLYMWRKKKKELKILAEQFMKEVDEDKNNGLRDKAFASAAVDKGIEGSLFGYRWLFLISPLGYVMLSSGASYAYSIGAVLAVVFIMWILNKMSEGFFGE